MHAFEWLYCQVWHHVFHYLDCQVRFEWLYSGVVWVWSMYLTVCMVRYRAFDWQYCSLGFEFCVFVAGWRHALRSEWPFIIIIIIITVPYVPFMHHNDCTVRGGTVHTSHGGGAHNTL